MLSTSRSLILLCALAASGGCGEVAVSAADGGPGTGGDGGAGRDDAGRGDAGGRDASGGTSACLTGGAGGPLADREFETFTDGQGQTSQFHVYAAASDPAGPVGLMLYTHGDGAYEFENPGYVTRDLAERAGESGLMMVAMLTPNPANGTTWWQEGEANGAWVRDLLEEEIFPSYDIDRSRVLVVGYSGGAQFTTKFFVPLHSDLLCGGGSLVFGGGGRPSGDVDPFDPEFVESFQMRWYTGEDDRGCNRSGTCGGYDAYLDSSRGAAFYEERGFAVTLEQPAGVNHYNIEYVDVLDEALEGGIVAPPAGAPAP